MADRSYWDWPFLDDGHRDLVAELEAFAQREIAPHAEDHGDIDGICRRFVASLGEVPVHAGQQFAIDANGRAR